MVPIAWPVYSYTIGSPSRISVAVSFGAHKTAESDHEATQTKSPDVNPRAFSRL